MNVTDKITDHFSKELDLTERLVAILKEEELALIHQNIAEITSLASKKSTLISGFVELKNQRIANLKTTGIPLEERDISKWIKSQNHEGIHYLWDKLTAKLSLAQEINRTNGMMIARLSNMNRTALQHLMGKDPVKSIYGFQTDTKNTSKFNAVG